MGKSGKIRLASCRLSGLPIRREWLWQSLKSLGPTKESDVDGTTPEPLPVRFSWEFWAVGERARLFRTLGDGMTS